MSEKTVTIGGQTFPLPAEITLGVIKRFNEARKEVDSKENDAVETTLLAVRIVSAALIDAHPELAAEEIERRLTPSEFAGMRSAMWEVLVATGLYVRVAPGDKKPGEGAAPPDPPAAP